MSPKSLKFIKFLTVLTLLLCCASLIAQTIDHRNFYPMLDSLELVLATNPPTGVELVNAYHGLSWGYLHVNSEKSMNYARKCFEIAVQSGEWKIAADAYWLLGLKFDGYTEYDSAKYFFEKSLEAVERMRDFPKRWNEISMS